VSELGRFEIAPGGFGQGSGPIDWS